MKTLQTPRTINVENQVLNGTTDPHDTKPELPVFIETPRLYVACLAAYNSGFLHGCWIEATLPCDEIVARIKAMLATSPVPDAEEHAIHDYEYFGSHQIGEYESIQSAHEKACFIDDHGDLGAELLNYFSDLEEAKEAMEEHYSGCYTSLTHFAEDFIEQTVCLKDIPEHLRYYIDYEALGHDMEMSGDIMTIETGFEALHIFWAR